jgi:hypothetical protein
MKGDYIKPFLPQVVLNTLLGLFAVLFFLNTIGNLMAETTIEKGHIYAHYPHQYHFVSEAGS